MNLDIGEKEKIIEICKRNDISYCAVFGSYARDEATDASDLDLLVRFSKPKGFDWTNAAFEIEEALGKQVDLVTENGLHPRIRENVLKDLQVIYER